MKTIETASLRPREITLIKEGVTVKFTPPSLCLGLYHIRFMHEGRPFDGYILPGGLVQGGSYQGSYHVVEGNKAASLIKAALSPL